jgi:hypothetical protein
MIDHLFQTNLLKIVRFNVRVHCSLIDRNKTKLVYQNYWLIVYKLMIQLTNKYLINKRLKHWKFRIMLQKIYLI